MANARKGFKRIMGEIPEEVHEKITWYNKISARTLNVSKAIEICLSREVEKIEQEAIDFVKENKGISRGSNVDYNNAVEGIKTGLPAYDVYKIAISNMFVRPRELSLRSRAYLPLLPVNRMHYDEEKQKICFFVDKLFCFSLSPYLCTDLDEETEEDEN